MRAASKPLHPATLPPVTGFGGFGASCNEIAYLDWLCPVGSRPMGPHGGFARPRVTLKSVWYEQGQAPALPDIYLRIRVYAYIVDGGVGCRRDVLGFRGEDELNSGGIADGASLHPSVYTSGPIW